MSIYSVNILSVCVSVMLQKGFATYGCFHPCFILYISLSLYLGGYLKQGYVIKGHKSPQGVISHRDRVLQGWSSPQRIHIFLSSSKILPFLLYISRYLLYFKGYFKIG